MVCGEVIPLQDEAFQASMSSQSIIAKAFSCADRDIDGPLLAAAALDLNVLGGLPTERFAYHLPKRSPFLTNTFYSCYPWSQSILHWGGMAWQTQRWHDFRARTTGEYKVGWFSLRYSSQVGQTAV